MNRNKDLIQAIIQHKPDKVKDLLDEKKYFDMAADVNYQPEND